MKINSPIKYFLLLLVFLFQNATFGQLSNDECDFAKFIPNVDEYCSEKNAFTNVNASKSPQPKPFCWPQDTEDSDVWFSFTPKNLGVFIQVTGETLTQEGTLKSPSVAVYSGDCNALSEVVCGSVLVGDNAVELTITDLNIGALYFIRVDGRAMEEGTFKLCINTFTPIKSPEADCKDAVVLCDKEEIFIKNLAGIGTVKNEVDPASCLQEEFASVWYKWTCKDAGNLTFDILPNSKADDIDFALYKLPNGLNDCNNKALVRCMASGETIGNPLGLNSPCFGVTGLSATATDIVETPGCQSGDDNYVKDIQMIPGESYVLLVNNFSQSGFGFSISWGGTGTFLGPEVDFETKSLDRFECDKEVVFTNKSKSLTDSIISYKWSFGFEATPLTATNFGPIDVVYGSFGSKTAALTVESKRGCTVTKIVDLFINPCCKDTTTLEVNGIAQDIPCFDLNTGQIDAQGRNGSPKYTYSLDSINFQPSPRFSDLKAGIYTLYIRDKKGCINQTNLIVNQPPKVTADAGEDIIVELGESSQLSGNGSGGTGLLNPLWSPKDSIAFVDQFSTPFLPLKDKSYTLTVTDENGCTGTDLVNVRVKIVRPVFAPNIIKSGLEGFNGTFKLEGGKAVRKVKTLEVYDRWGNKMYVGRDLDIKNLDEGWQADFNGKKVNPGVYVWLAVVEFIDDVEITLSGDVTVVE
jgi:hypothetical protein